LIADTLRLFVLLFFMGIVATFMLAGIVAFWCIIDYVTEPADSSARRSTVIGRFIGKWDSPKS